MNYRSVSEFTARGAHHLVKGPVGLIFIEDEVEVASTIAHHLRLGFAALILFVPDQLALEDLPDGVVRVGCDTHAKDVVPEVLSQIIAVTPPTVWLYWGYNGEYLFFPFCETRTLGEMLAFHSEERREAMISYVVDLYAPDLTAHPNAVCRESAMFDRTGYFAAQRFRDGVALERQMDIFGGIRWRYEEHIPWTRRRLDRAALFRAKKGLRMRSDMTLSEEEMNTLSCPWHNNLTAAVASFRTAKALRSNPGSKWAIANFSWGGSVRFEWSSRQLLELGLMETGQWF